MSPRGFFAFTKFSYWLKFQSITNMLLSVNAVAEFGWQSERLKIFLESIFIRNILFRRGRTVSNKMYHTTSIMNCIEFRPSSNILKAIYRKMLLETKTVQCS